MTSGFRAIGPAGKSPLSPAVDTGALVFISGQVGTDVVTRIAPADVRDQARIALERVGALLKEAGLGFSDLAKVNVYLADMRDLPAFNEIYAQYFTGDVKPARSTVGAPLPKPNFRVEVEAVAVRHWGALWAGNR
jgi:Putative translation initiation inhibitor, yjgF family